MNKIQMNYKYTNQNTKKHHKNTATIDYRKINSIAEMFEQPIRVFGKCHESTTRLSMLPLVIRLTGI